MMLWLALFVATGCTLASARRLWLVTAPTWFDVRALVERLPKADPLIALGKMAASAPAAVWERELVAAFEAPSEVRSALVNEQLGEFDLNVARWSRVPRVCARVSTSLCLVIATLVLRGGLTASDALSPNLQALVLHGFIGEALSVVAFGIAGAAFCGASHTQAQIIARERRKAVDDLLDLLERAGQTS